MKKKLGLVAVVLILAAGLSFGPVSSKEPVANGETSAIESNEDILRFHSKEEIVRTIKEHLEKNRTMYKGEVVNEAMTGASESAGVPSSADMAVKSAHSTTNVQVQGVDEADIVKTDGIYIYHLRERELVISKAYPAESFEVFSRIKLAGNFDPRELFVEGKRVAVLGITHDVRMLHSQSETKDSIYPVHDTATSVLIYDATDRKNPELVRQIDLQGQYVSSRKIGDRLHMATNQYVRIYSNPDHPILEEHFLPKYRDSVKSGEFAPLDVKHIYHFPGDSSSQYLNLASVSLSDANAPVAVSSYLGGGRQMYMSEKNMYIAKSDWTGSWESQKSRKENTSLYKFAVTENGLVYKGRGEVPGRLLNQFSMDEHKGYLRVATTTDMFNEKQENNLYVLDGNLNVTGRVEGLARGERIYSVRFMGDRGYVVTFKNVDPLFTLDLKDPKQPKVMGELKIPGFSNYLHPYDENHVIGFGRDTEEKTLPDGRTVAVQKGIKLSMFDVSDMKNPKELFTTVVGDPFTHSPLQNDHKALLFSKEKNLFAFPVIRYNNEQDAFYGFYVYGIDLRNGFGLKGKVDMRDNVKYGNWPQRMIYIGDTLYSISNDIYKFHDARTLEEVRNAHMFYNHLNRK
ncbi:beta-propeller domain-containing protein [Effusibacillus lacus]|uniref:Beta propeller domain-containing protein n=1 Tax=Effusibacillus lacus TaxID=1348429 RepID=A0A292YQB5_9BACL|nr:beta-propeller domain-containing protein [Effusibacillus lacus]TCS75629.1 putative secreted protein with C-terminal beta-propeller domain [Effusibacillus lacus]GAX90953.1 hypothetical protein EFBL_2613 [Effusibacillus lacus]